MEMTPVFLNRMLTAFFACVSPGLQAGEAEVHDEDEERRNEHPGVVDREHLVRHVLGERGVRQQSYAEQRQQEHAAE